MMIQISNPGRPALPGFFFPGAGLTLGAEIHPK